MDVYSDATFKKVVYTAVYAALFAAAVFLFAKYLFAAVLPFVIAWFFAALLRSPVAFLSEKTRLPKGFFAALFVTALFAAVAALTVLSVSEAAAEASRLLSGISAGNVGADAFWERIKEWTARIPLINEYVDTARESVRNAAGEFLSGILARIPSVAASLASVVPGAVIFTVTLLLAAVYMTADYRLITSFLTAKLPKKPLEKLVSLKRRTVSGTLLLLRAYLRLFLLTFGELALGFAILGRKYVFLPALLIAAVDFLPVFGTGVALIPMSAAGFITGDVLTGVGMLVLYGVITVVRQIVEPRIVGSSLGVHPLLTLAAMYFGLRVFGIWGMIASPVAASVISAAALKKETA